MVAETLGPYLSCMTNPSTIRIVYDGDCPFCAAYMHMIRLREASGGVDLIDARSDHPILGRIRSEGLDLDQGMVVEMDGALYHGDTAMTVMAAMTTRSGLFNRLVRLMFARPRIARLVYPPMVLGRNITLRLLGRRRIGDRTA